MLRALLRYSTFGVQAEAAAEAEAGEGRDGDGDGDAGGEKEKEKEKDKSNDNGTGKRRWKKRWTHSYAADEMLFYRLAKCITSGSAIQNIQDAVELLLVCIQWMELVTAAGNVQHEVLNLGAHGTAEEIHAATIELGTLLAAVIDNGYIIRALGKGSAPKGTGKQLSKTLANFVPLLLQSSPQNATRLGLFRTQTMVAIEPVDKKGDCC